MVKVKIFSKELNNITDEFISTTINVKRIIKDVYFVSRNVNIVSEYVVIITKKVIIITNYVDIFTNNQYVTSEKLRIIS